MPNKYITDDVYNLIKNGYFALYKPPGITSAVALERLKAAIYEVGVAGNDVPLENKHMLRAGHGGNLDSSAQGVLPVGLCNGCKLLPLMLKGDKKYRVTAKLGEATDTYNDTGKVIEECRYGHVTRNMVEKELEGFQGEIYQKPPAYSALKIQGRRASDLARVGKQVNLMSRPVMCYSASCVTFDPPFITMDFFTGHGFYVRSLVHDLGKALDTCAHVTDLVRLKHGPFVLEDCLYPENLTLDNIVKAISETRIKHPRLYEELDSYFKDKEKKKKKHIELYKAYMEKKNLKKMNRMLNNDPMKNNFMNNLVTDHNVQ